MRRVAGHFFDYLLGEQRSYKKVKSLFSIALDRSTRKDFKKKFFKDITSIPPERREKECLIQSSQVGKLMCRVDYICYAVFHDEECQCHVQGFIDLYFCEEEGQIKIRRLTIDIEGS